MKSYKGLMENIPYPGHKCSDGTSPFYKAKNKWKTNLMQEELQPQKTDNHVERVRSVVRSYRRLMLRMIINELNLNRYHTSNFNTGFGRENSVRQDGSKKPHN